MLCCWFWDVGSGARTRKRPMRSCLWPAGGQQGRNNLIHTCKVLGSEFFPRFLRKKQSYWTPASSLNRQSAAGTRHGRLLTNSIGLKRCMGLDIIFLMVVYWGVNEKLTYSVMHVFRSLLMARLYWSQNLFHITVTREISIFSCMFSLRSIVMRHMTKGNECGCMFACEMTPYSNSGNTEKSFLVLTLETYTYMLKVAIKKIIKLLSQGSPNFFHHSLCFSPWGFPGCFLINAVYARLWKTELRDKHRLLKTFFVQAEKTLTVLGGMLVWNTQTVDLKDPLNMERRLGGQKSNWGTG